TLALQARIAGQLAERGPARTAQLAFDAKASWLRIEVHEAHAAAGGARATVAGTASRDAADRPWRVRGRGTPAGLDPAAWWRGPAGPAWRRGPHRLEGDADVDLVWRQAPPRADWLAQLAALRGQADVTLRRSVLAGVPLAGTAAVRTAAD